VSGSARGNRAAIEQALPETWVAAIGEMCATLGLPRSNWDAVPGFRVVAEAIALYKRADELRQQNSWPQERALLVAGEELHLNADSISRRLREWLRTAYP